MRFLPNTANQALWGANFDLIAKNRHKSLNAFGMYIYLLECPRPCFLVFEIMMRKEFKLIALFLIVSLFSFGCYSVTVQHLGNPVGPAYTKRGKELVEGLAACGFCHGAKASPDSRLSGGQELSDRYGTIIAPNLTPGTGGLRGWDTDALIRVVRSSIGIKEEEQSREHHRGYEWMSDEDLLSIIAYIQALPPVKTDYERRELNFYDRNILGFSEGWRDIGGYVPALKPASGPEYGKYLVDHVARCGRCHSGPEGLFSSAEYLGGGQLIQYPDGREVYATNITQSEMDGLVTWSVQDITSFLKTGRRPDGSRIETANCPIEFYSRASADDLQAIAVYLKTVSKQ